MNPEQQRLKIAEACGWRLNKNKHTSKSLDWIGPDDQRTYMPPDYLKDLNACHEMERALDDDQRFNYETTLHSLNQKYGLGISVWETIHANAAQRCEALLRTLGLWEEGGKYEWHPASERAS